MDVANLTVLLSRLSEAAGRLNRASDSINQRIANVEARLVEANIGIDAWLQHPLASSEIARSIHGDDSWSSQFLGYTKVDGEWCLAVKVSRFEHGHFQGDSSARYQNEYKEADPVRLARAPRDIRIAALEQIPELVQLLTEEADRRAETIEKAKTLM
jgi:hypothetical protein